MLRPFRWRELEQKLSCLVFVPVHKPPLNRDLPPTVFRALGLIRESTMSETRTR